MGKLTLNLLSPDVCCFENIVNSDQLASQKPAVQDSQYIQNTVFHSACIHSNNLNWIKIGEE